MRSQWRVDAEGRIARGEIWREWEGTRTKVRDEVGLDTGGGDGSETASAREREEQKSKTSVSVPASPGRQGYR